MNNEYILIENQLPDKGKHIVGIDSDERMHYCYRCACKKLDCVEWFDSFTNEWILIDIVKWIYA